MRYFSSVVVILALFACGEEDLSGIENDPPTANAGLNRDALVGERVSFDGSASTDADGEIVGFAWSFGDEVDATGLNVTHIYTAAGAFTVSLKVTDDIGATDVHTITVTVSDNLAPLVVIDAPLTAVARENVRVDGSLSSDPDGTLASFTWDLGDGQERFGSIVDYVYETPGSYLITLTVVDDAGSSVSGDHEITIEDAPTTLSGTWNWFLVDDTMRDLGFPCGTFQDSALQIVANEPTIAITEEAGGFSATYNGSLTSDGHFETLYSSFGVSQTIIGDFTSSTTFTGTYGLDPGFGDGCPDRDVTGVKVGE